MLCKHIIRIIHSKVITELSLISGDLSNISRLSKTSKKNQHRKYTWLAIGIHVWPKANCPFICDIYALVFHAIFQCLSVKASVWWIWDIVKEITVYSIQKVATVLCRFSVRQLKYLIIIKCQYFADRGRSRW